MDDITVGLDFGTHQTKICMKTCYNEDFMHPVFEFFTFTGLQGEKSYFLPSVVQLNADDTLSYGFVDPARRKKVQIVTAEEPDGLDLDFDESERAVSLYEKYAAPFNTMNDIPVLVDMLKLYKQRQLENLKNSQEKSAQDEVLQTSPVDPCYFQYFKQAVFAQRTWEHELSAEMLSIWYLSYIIFLLEERYGYNFHINMGIPVCKDDYDHKQMYATTLLLSAYHLVEDVYHNDMQAFLAETVDNLLAKTELQFGTPELKKQNAINIYPEAYAGLTTLTARGRLSHGMSLIVDIGGGTTDISFFTVGENKPVIYGYWSIPKGLNYIAEASHFKYNSKLLSHMAADSVVESYFSDQNNIVSRLFEKLMSQLMVQSGLPRTRLIDAFKDRPVVFNGGGSTFTRLLHPFYLFTEVKLMDADMWRETDIVHKQEVLPLSQLLTTAYGLSIGYDDEDEVHIGDYHTLIPRSDDADDDDRHYKSQLVDKDYC